MTPTTRRITVLAVLVGVLALVSLALGSFVVWQSFDPRETSTGETDAPAETSWPRFVSESELRAFGTANGPVYWAGPQEDSLYELTITSSGTFYVRYLPKGTELGDPRDSFLTVATYSNVDGYENLVQAGAQEGATVVSTASGALIVTTTDAPLSTYFGFEGLDFQVEVFSPNEGASLSIVEDGLVELLR